MRGCQNCCEPELFKTFRALNEDYVPGAYTVNEYDEELKNCPVCGQKLFKNDYIVDNRESFLNDSLAFLAEKINKEIYECQKCNWTIISYEQRHGDPLNLNTVNELIDSYYIPSHLKVRLINYLKCNCGNPVSFEDPYVTKEELEDWFDVEKDFIISTFNISGEETIEFIDFLQKYPMLGLSHPVGIEIFNKIKDNKFSGIEEIKPGQIYYRGRTRNKLQRLIPFVEDELWNPPHGVPNQGRYNPHGVTNLYLGNKEDAVILEISPSGLEIVDIAEFEIIQSLKVFDSTKTDIDIFAGMEKKESGFNSAYEYIFPNFLAQCLAHHGFNGVVYKSIKDSTSLNLCLFNFRKDENIRMSQIHENANLSDYDDPFGLQPKRNTVILKEKQMPDLTDLF